MQTQRTTLAPDLEICRILNGMWQLAGGHGQINSTAAISEMFLYHNAGFTTWDMADIYGPAEEYYGQFRKRFSEEKGSDELSKVQGFTKFVPSPGPMTRSIVEHGIKKSIQRMNINEIDMVQFHWWDYNNPNYIDALYHLSKLKEEGLIRHIGLTNFDTERMQIMLEQGFKVVSNQVQYSIIDKRPEVKMIPLCQKNGIKIVTYGTLLGGFLSEKYLASPEPTRVELDTSSLQKYKQMIDLWGGWNLFQDLLHVLNKIAVKHGVNIANVATKYVLDKSCVAGVIIGTRLGIANHISDNAKTFSLQLDGNDNSLIESVTSQSQDLFERIGDCGDEYR